MDDKSLHDLFGNLGLVAISSGKNILLLEGPSDIAIMSILYPELQPRFSLYPLGGKGNISNFISAFERITPELELFNVKIFGLLDNDRAKVLVNRQQATRDRLFTLPATNLENFLIDKDAIYDALKVHIGVPKLQESGVNNSAGVGTLIDAIVNKSEFLDAELRTRLDEEISLNIGIKDMPLDVVQIAARIDSIAEQKKSKLAEIINRERLKQGEAITLRRYRSLNGKLILGFIASKFNLQRETLAKLIADKLVQLENVPTDLTAIVSRLGNTRGVNLITTKSIMRVFQSYLPMNLHAASNAQA